MQKLSNSIKKPNMPIMGIKEGEAMQAKGIHNICNKIKVENFLNLNKEFAIQV
jgi:hypothetical protein